METDPNLPDQDSTRRQAPEAEPFGSSDDNATAQQAQIDSYRRLPASERNWQRDTGFQFLPETEKQQELIAEAIRDVRALLQTIRHGVSNQERQRRLRDLLAAVEFELQKNQYHSL